VSGDDQFSPNLIGDETHIRSETQRYVAISWLCRDFVTNGQQRNHEDFVFPATLVDGEIIGCTIKWAKAVQQAGL
jgi:hypothetical protein